MLRTFYIKTYYMVPSYLKAPYNVSCLYHFTSGHHTTLSNGNGVSSFFPISYSIPCSISVPCRPRVYFIFVQPPYNISFNFGRIQILGPRNPSFWSQIIIPFRLLYSHWKDNGLRNHIITATKCSTIQFGMAKTLAVAPAASQSILPNCGEYKLPKTHLYDNGQRWPRSCN